MGSIVEHSAAKCQLSAKRVVRTKVSREGLSSAARLRFDMGIDPLGDPCVWDTGMDSGESGKAKDG